MFSVHLCVMYVLCMYTGAISNATTGGDCIELSFLTQFATFALLTIINECCDCDSKLILILLEGVENLLNFCERHEVPLTIKCHFTVSEDECSLSYLHHCLDNGEIDENIVVQPFPLRHEFIGRDFNPRNGTNDMTSLHSCIILMQDGSQLTSISNNSAEDITQNEEVLFTSPSLQMSIPEDVSTTFSDDACIDDVPDLPPKQFKLYADSPSITNQQIMQNENSLLDIIRIEDIDDDQLFIDDDQCPNSIVIGSAKRKMNFVACLMSDMHTTHILRRWATPTGKNSISMEQSIVQQLSFKILQKYFDDIPSLF